MSDKLLDPAVQRYVEQAAAKLIMYERYDELFDRYCDLARSLGSPSSAIYGAPLWSHEKLVNRAREATAALCGQAHPDDKQDARPTVILAL